MQSVTVDISEGMMFANIANLKDLSQMPDETHVSVEGSVRKVIF